ncbi:MAG: hypothetical protein EXR29_08190 [Betaproteobacteria bacterium]|nr:hypothetical protein [Betaproteobacteria bacterium]
MRSGKQLLPADFFEFVESRSCRMPFLDPMKLFLKTRLHIGTVGATYLMKGSQYDYLHRYFCSLEDGPPVL